MRTLLATLLLAVPAVAAPTKITWHGHATFEIVTPKGKVLWIDPWLKNPANPNKDPLAAAKADYLLVTHGHSDHTGDAVELGKKTGAKLVAPVELGHALVQLGFPKTQAGLDTLGNTGGSIVIAEGEVTVDFVPANHPSGVDAGGDKPMLYGGNAVGYVVHIKDGPTVYHSGDTAYIDEMAQVGESAPDLALINIGGHFGMEPPAAARAAKAVKGKLVVPMHYKTFPILTQDAKPFFDALDKLRIAHRDLKPGESLEYDGKKLKR